MTLTTTPTSCVEAIRSRRSWLGWTGEALPRELLDEILADTATAPSECNLQPWRFVVAQGASLERLLPAFLSSNQPKLREAGTLVVLFGDPQAIELDPKAVAFYGLGFSTKRDCIVRNVSLAASTLMLAAWGRGIATRPMIGFDPEPLSKLCEVPARWLPVVAVAAGFPGAPAHGPRDRRAADEVTTWL